MYMSKYMVFISLTKNLFKASILSPRFSLKTFFISITSTSRTLRDRMSAGYKHMILASVRT